MMMSMVLEPLDVVERYLGLSSDPKAAYQEIADWLKRQIKTERWDDLREALPRLMIPGLDFTSAFSLYRMMQQVSRRVRLHDRQTKIAVLGSCTTHQLNSLIELYLCAGSVGAEIYEADYGTYRQELLDPESELNGGS